MLIARIVFFASAVLAVGRGHALAGVKLVVVEPNRVLLPEPLDRLDLLEEVTKELASRGCPVIDSCRTSDCQGKAIAAGASDVLGIVAEYRREQYSCSVAMELRPATEGPVKLSSRFASATCPAMDLVDHAKELAARACEQLLSEKPAPPLAVAPVAEVRSSERTFSPRGAVLAGGGALLAGLGVTLWYLHGRCAHSAMLPGETGCRDLYDTRTIGIPLTVVGVASMAVGGVMLWRDHRTALALGPGVFILAGRF